MPLSSVCPFCFLGLRKIEKGISTSSLIAAAPSAGSQAAVPNPSSSSAVFSAPKIKFLPYELDPALPLDEPVNKRQRYESRFGADRVAAMEEQMRSHGREYGIEFNYDGTVRGTLLSHRLMHRALEQGGWTAQKKLLEVLFPYYFEKAGDPGDPEQLGRIGAEAGLFDDAKQGTEWLTKTHEAEPEVKEGISLAKQKGITGVPHFEIVAGGDPDEPGDVAAGKKLVKAEIPGAQEPDTFVAVFRQLAEAYKKANGEGVAPVPAGAKC